MKKITIALLVLLALACFASAADITIREIRDPVKFKAWIAANISDVSGVATNIAGASIVSGNIAQARITNALASAGALVKGNIPAASLTNAVAATIMPAYASGTFKVVNTTNLAFVAGSVTNIIDEDITTP